MEFKELTVKPPFLECFINKVFPQKHELSLIDTLSSFFLLCLSLMPFTSIDNLIKGPS